MILTENQRRLIAAGHATTDGSPIQGPIRESGSYQREAACDQVARFGHLF